MIRPSDHPMYGTPYPPKDVVLVADEAGSLESGIRTAREAAGPYYLMGLGSVQRGRELLETAFAHSRTLYEKKTDEGGSIPKAAAITAGGLTGLIIASRKGFIRKILYTGFGLTAAAAACYPQQSRELFDISTFIARRRGPEFIKDITGIDVAPYLDSDKIKSLTDSASSSSSSSRTQSPEKESSK